MIIYVDGLKEERKEKKNIEFGPNQKKIVTAELAIFLRLITCPVASMLEKHWGKESRLAQTFALKVGFKFWLILIGNRRLYDQEKKINPVTFYSFHLVKGAKQYKTR
jgi:hypothetical protein